MGRLDVVDDDDNVIGNGTIDEVHERRQLHRTSGVLVFRDDSFKEILIQKRSEHHVLRPGAWAFTTGHVPSGGTYDGTARMELAEEMFHGMDPPDLRLERLFTFRKIGDGDEEFMTVYRTVYDGTFSVEPHEVSDWAWIRVEDLERELRKNPEKYTETTREMLERYREHERG